MGWWVSNLWKDASTRRVKGDGGAKVTLRQIGWTSHAAWRDRKDYSPPAMRPPHHPNAFAHDEGLVLQVPERAIGVVDRSAQARTRPSQSVATSRGPKLSGNSTTYPCEVRSSAQAASRATSAPSLLKRPLQPCSATIAGNGPIPSGFMSSPRSKVGLPPVRGPSSDGKDTLSPARAGCHAASNTPTIAVNSHLPAAAGSMQCSNSSSSQSLARREVKLPARTKPRT